jgi:hypothetical protein
MKLRNAMKTPLVGRYQSSQWSVHFSPVPRGRVLQINLGHTGISIPWWKSC